MTIRILLPKDSYHSERIRLVERVTCFQRRKLNKVSRLYEFLEQDEDIFLEGFLENQRLLPLIKNMLSDNPVEVRQSSELFSDIETILIEDSDEIHNAMSY